MGQGDDLASFLEEASLSAYQPQLVALGVAAPADIADVDGVQHTRTTLNPKPTLTRDRESLASWCPPPPLSFSPT